MDYMDLVWYLRKAFKLISLIHSFEDNVSHLLSEQYSSILPVCYALLIDNKPKYLYMILVYKSVAKYQICLRV